MRCRPLAPTRSGDLATRVGLQVKRIPGMLVWREGLYAFMQRNAERPDAYFCIPAAQVVEMGIEIEI